MLPVSVVFCCPPPDPLGQRHRAPAPSAPFHPGAVFHIIGYHDGGQSETRARLIARSAQEYLLSGARNSYR
jgi:hypothetical protein